MWLIGLIALVFPFIVGFVVYAALARQFGPGPLSSGWVREWRSWPLRPRVAPFSRWQRRVARKVLYPIGEVEGLTWSQQRAVYWRVRRFPDRKYEHSMWGAAFLGVVVATICSLVAWGCGFSGASGLSSWTGGWSRPVRESWIPQVAMLASVVWLLAPLAIGGLAAVGLARDDARDAIRRYVGSRIESCDRCKYPLSKSMAGGRGGRVVRCPECGLGHDLRWRSPARSPGRRRKRAPTDGPTLIARGAAARACQGVASLRGRSPEACARLLDHALWVEGPGVTTRRCGATILAIGVAVGVILLLWPAIEAALGAHLNGRLTGSNALSMAIAMLGPAAGVAVWLWMERLMLRGLARRAGERRGLSCIACGYSLEGLPPGETGLVVCPECGGSAFPAEGVPRVLRADEMDAGPGSERAE